LSITLDLQVAYFGNGQEVLIKKGQPLVHYIPFKREKINFITKLMNDKDLYKLNSNAVAVASKAGGGWAAIPREEN
jgi:hypothetical protein